MKSDSPAITDTAQSVHCVSVNRFSMDSETPQLSDDQLIVEQPVTIMVDQVGSYTIMCTPCDVEAMAVGFLYSEGVIDDLHDIVSVSSSKADPKVIGVQLADTSGVSVARNLIVASSCGMCGARTIEKTLADTEPVGSSMTIDAAGVCDVMERLRERQTAYLVTGGAHAAGVFDSAGEFLSVAEDIGRHNAVDKAIGKCLLAGQPMAGCGIALSGRVSFEMVAKSARAGIELIVAVSAASSFAVESANRWNMTLCGFVRDERANIYTHPQRIRQLRDAPDAR
ncbi:MAG: formate dehydrogenase accessory sulfurtransferase FdhD [Planctomycetota bacterium]